MTDFFMPSLGADMEAGTLVEWLHKPGDPVKRGDVVAVVETQKGAIEIEVFEDGIIERLLVEPGRKVPVGTPLAIIRQPGEVIAAPAPVVSTSVTAAVSTAAEAVLPKPSPSVPPEGRRRISPAAAARAVELGRDLRTIRGTGPAGAVTLRDVDAPGALPTPSATRSLEPLTGETAPGSAMRNAIGAAMGRSKREIPHYYLSSQIDMRSALAWIDETNRIRPIAGRLLVGVLLLKAVARAVRELPEFNGYWVDGAFRPGNGINVGWATSLRTGGLIAPAIHDADGKSIDELMEALRDLVRRARSGGIRSSELSAGTITVTSLGERGVETVFGIIYPPQVALVGFGKIVSRPWAEDGTIAPTPVMTATLAADHRASDGHRGGIFLGTIDRLLQEPDKL